jgi:transcriptional regulator with XRE-family HTH domain
LNDIEGKRQPDRPAEPSGRHARRADPIDIFVGGRIRARRITLGITQEKLAGRLGLTFQQIQKYEKGVNRVSAGTLHRLSDVLSVPIQFFFSDSEDERPVDAPSGLLQDRQAAAVLRAFARITDKQARQAVLEFIRTLVPSGRDAKHGESD